MQSDSSDSDAIFDPFPSAQLICLKMADKIHLYPSLSLSKTCNISLCSVRKTALYMGTGAFTCIQASSSSINPCNVQVFASWPTWAGMSNELLQVLQHISY